MMLANKFSNTHRHIKRWKGKYSGAHICAQEKLNSVSFMHSIKEGYMQFLSLINAENTGYKNTRKDILRQLMFIKQPAEMKPIRLCSHEKHSHPGDCHTHTYTHTPGCMNIIAARQPLFPVSSFLPGLQINLGSAVRSEIVHTHGSYWYSCRENQFYIHRQRSLQCSRIRVRNQGAKQVKNTEQFITMVTNPTVGKKVIMAVNFKWHRCTRAFQ